VHRCLCVDATPPKKNRPLAGAECPVGERWLLARSDQVAPQYGRANISRIFSECRIWPPNEGSADCTHSLGPVATSSRSMASGEPTARADQYQQATRDRRMKIMIFFPVVLVPTIYYGLEIFQTIEHSNQYDSVSPVLPRDLVNPAILVFSKTNSYRHDSIDAANAMFREIANERGWGIFETENGAVFNAAQLGRFKAVVWNNVSGDVLTPPQQLKWAAASLVFMEAGATRAIGGAGTSIR
jgi:Trehalose utilisation